MTTLLHGLAAHVRDEHTTLPERVDRPLFIVMDVFWRYTNVEDLVHAAVRRGPQ